MTCSCCASKPKQGRAVCPDCGLPAFPVSRQTMLHQLQFPDNQSIADGDYAFCSNRDCQAGYFSSSDTIAKKRMRALQPGQEVMLCHCFDISEAVYQAALDDGTAKSIKAFVVQQTKEKLCACESRNPSGRCCLASFKQMEKAHDC